MIGSMGNYLHLRIVMADADSYLALLKLVTREFHSAYRHYDFDRVSDFIPECRTELCFNWLPSSSVGTRGDGSRVAGGALELRPFPLRAAWSNKFLPFFCEGESEVKVSVAYWPGTFSAQTIQRFGRNLLLFANEMVEHPLSRVWSTEFSS